MSRCGRWSWHCCCRPTPPGSGTSGDSCWSGAGSSSGGAEEMEEYASLVEVVDEALAERVRREARGARALLN